MQDLISRQAAIEKIHSEFDECLVWDESGKHTADEVERILDTIPPADVRPVVTCAECDWHVDCGYHFCNKWCQPCPDNADFYCAYGERTTAVPT